MFRHFFRPPRRTPTDVQAEVQSICRDRQMRQLSCFQRRDIGLDCGCEETLARLWQL